MQTCTVHAGWGPYGKERLAERNDDLRIRVKGGKQLKFSFKHDEVVDGKKPEQSVLA